MGRTNVGKSTLFNRLTGTRDALVADYPGLTRDRLYGFTAAELPDAVVIDTGGLVVAGDSMAALMQAQVGLALDEADAVLMVVDGQAGLVAEDHHVASLLRRSGKPVVLAVNKGEGREAAGFTADFWELGFGQPRAISASRGDGVRELLDSALACCPPADPGQDATDPAADPVPPGRRIAVLGRPNVGKSTLINRLLREERLVTRDEAGTTRDLVRVPFELEGEHFTLVDTAGLRRRAKVSGTIEKFSVAKTLQALDEADAVIVLLDAREGVTEQDASLIGLVIERGRALSIGINKWDGLSDSDRRKFMHGFAHMLPFLDFVEHHAISALHGSNILDLFRSAERAATAAHAELPTQELTRILETLVEAHPPPIVRRQRIRLSYAHQGGRRPPLIVVHGTQTALLPDSYRRFLINEFRRAFKLTGTPIRLELRTGKNPFAGRRNTLTRRQLEKRRRLRRRPKR